MQKSNFKNIPLTTYLTLKQAIIIPIQPAKLWQTVLLKSPSLQYFLEKHIAINITINSATIVVNAAPCSFHIGIKRKFSPTLTAALTIVESNIYFSSLCKSKTDVVKKEAISENIVAILSILNELTLSRYASPAIINTISLLVIITPTITGNTSTISTFAILSSKLLYSALFPSPNGYNN